MTKIEIEISEKLLEALKADAERDKLSLSEVIEQKLSPVVAAIPVEGKLSIADRWAGAFPPMSDEECVQAKHDYLMEKYGK